MSDNPPKPRPPSANRRDQRKYVKLAETVMDTRVRDEAEIAASSDALLDALQTKHPDYLKINRDVIFPRKKIK